MQFLFVPRAVARKGNSCLFVVEITIIDIPESRQFFQFTETLANSNKL
jgi:hypothetical protein